MSHSEEISFDHYQLVVEEEHYFLTEHQRRIAFFSSFITTILAATFAGFVSSDKWHHFYLLSAGPISVIVISYIAKMGVGRIYQRFLETITVRAKLEERLGFTLKPTQRQKNKRGWSLTEPIVPLRHLESRVDSSYASSREWVDAHLQKRENYHGVSIILFNTFIIIGVLILIALLATGTFLLISNVLQLFFG